ncbi:hypothetical protein A8709_28720 [Paenibacillus pectinilyticus]|uniref:HTH tetR-type domain-containing protein n=1 Tax=Paenibacillus pectinilyticus TaxID=512399 RepID=A0A1C0ZXA4_9BACL|nr:TetR/AcrR family transcriptional regulator [Paenibacillus pectinilyticus]OCT12726.1 hypothetical protein A8709_28720 [Paenibacillus pectinilyticus]
MNGYEKRAQLKKDNIMAATLELLKTTSAQAMRIADIASAAGVSQVTIYNYFGSKEVLVREVFITYIRKTITDFEAFMEAEHSLKEKIEYIIFQKKESSRTFGLQMMKQVWLEDPVLAKFVHEEYLARGIPMVIKLIEDGKKAGEISEKISTSTIMMYMQMMTNQADTMIAHAEKHNNMDTVIEEMVHLFFNGVRS